jgi:hypothetical protein
VAGLEKRFLVHFGASFSVDRKTVVKGDCGISAWRPCHEPAPVGGLIAVLSLLAQGACQVAKPLISMKSHPTTRCSTHQNKAHFAKSVRVPRMTHQTGASIPLHRLRTPTSAGMPRPGKAARASGMPLENQLGLHSPVI